MAGMSKRERIKAALAGKSVDRVPVGFWRHWPGDDQDEESLALITLIFQRHQDLDFIKFPVSSTYCVNDYGVKHEYQGSPGGDRVYLERVIKKPADWEKIELLDIHRGAYGMYLRAFQKVAKEKSSDTPLVATIFDPLAVAFYLAGDTLALVHLRQFPEKVEAALEAITETCAAFVRELITAGADGIFLSCRAASYDILNEEEYRRFCRPGDLKVLKAASEGWFNILHLHGQYPMFDQVADYPVQAVNWHDRTSSVDLATAAKIFPGTLMGGVEQYRVLHLGTPADVEAQVHDAIRQTGGNKLIISPGCTYPVAVPHVNLRAMRKAVENFSA